METEHQTDFVWVQGNKMSVVDCQLTCYSLGGIPGRPCGLLHWKAGEKAKWNKKIKIKEIRQEACKGKKPKQTRQAKQYWRR